MEEQRWLRQAEKDLESARDSLVAKHYEWACFQSQQAAEKALRAFLYSKGLRAILTHSIRDLVLDCSRYERDFGNLLSQGKVLDTYYIPTRYPNGLVGNEIPAQYYSEEDAGQCINYAELILRTVEKIYEQLGDLANLLKSKHKVKKVYLYGSFARGDFNEASDIDLIIVGEFEGKMPQRIKKVFDLTSLPVEPLVYTESEFEQMKERAFLKEVLATAKEL